MAENEELSSLERVRERLYSAQAATGAPEPTLVERSAERVRGWEKLKTVPTSVRKEAEHVSGPARFFIVAFLFFVLTAGGAVVYLVWGGRSVSANNLNIAVQGPTTIASGDTVPLLLTIENKNPVAITGASLTITFPAGTKSADDPTQPLAAYTEDLGTIDSGAKVERTVRAVVYGSEGQHISLPIKIEYHTAGSNSVFVKNKQYDFIITSSPISLTVSALSQVSAGQSTTVNVTVRSNATTPLDNVAVIAQYPFGFTPTATSPQPSTGTVFALGTFAAGEEKRISITGIVSGENNDERVFKFDAGTLAAAGSNTLAQTFTSQQANITLTKPFLATTLSINRDTTDTPVVDAGVPVQVTIGWVNTLATPVTNARVAVAISGNGFDPTSVTSGSGFYRSTDGTVLFDSTTDAGLAMLQPGDSGQGTFTFTTKKNSALMGTSNPSITLRVSVAGQRLSETNVPQTITATLNRTVKVGTSLALSSKAVRTTGPFANTGPWPPVANQESTYTVVYTLTNSGNTVAGAQVTAALPPYVRFTGQTTDSTSLSYNDTTRTVSWSAGDVPSGTSVKTVAFQIAITPSVAQQGTTPILLFAQQVTGVDRFTQHAISGSVPELTTQTSSDPAYKIGFGTVK
ncbi:MAG: protein of unknown function with transrane region [Parcubacteria group bacterium]|nr:protein of unknown function with transrane region [Parcubacteria group bacterium]